ncbi:hypothetical protein Bca101_090329 [Brassica carinata]
MNYFLDKKYTWATEITRGFTISLNFDAKEGLDPKVSSWGKVGRVIKRGMRSRIFTDRRKKNNKTVVPRIKVKIVRSYIDKKMIFGNDLTIDNGEIEVENGRRKHIVSGVVVLLAPQVRAQGLGLCKKKQQLYIIVSNPEVQRLGWCAWSFQIASKGPHGMTNQPPSGEIGADALVIQLATGLADVTPSIQL